MKKKKVSKNFTFRKVYRAFVRNQAYENYRLKKGAKWFSEEVSMAKDLNNRQDGLIESEKQIARQTLRALTRTKARVNEYWSTKEQRYIILK